MEIKDIFKLIDAGFTKEDIIEMSKPAETVADISQAKSEPITPDVKTESITPEETHSGNIDYIKDLQKSIDDLKKTIIATNQLRDLGGEKHTSIDDINDYIINGRNKK
jgi:hypothetical protein